MSKIKTQLTDVAQQLSSLQEPQVLLTYTDVLNTEITNRAKIVDFANDLGARKGIERVPIKQIARVPGEKGPNDKPVFKPVDDFFDRCRFVGDIVLERDANGNRVILRNTDDFIEISFWGTGLNILYTGGLSGDDVRVTIDGGVESSNIIVNQAGAPSGRNIDFNAIIPVMSGDTQDFHTVKLRHVSGSATFHGYEIINETSDIKVNPGSAIIDGNKETLTSQASVTPGAATSGTRGGREVIYLKDGQIQVASQAAETSQTNGASATFANEEVIESHFWPAFGAGRDDDFEKGTESSTNDRAFTLDDGTTSLTHEGTGFNQSTATDPYWGVYLNGPGESMVFSFMGTGFDMDMYGNTNDVISSTTSVFVDGVETETATTFGGPDGVIQRAIVSGLPYGFHTVRLETIDNSGNEPVIFKYNIYGPKKPTLPDGAIEIADYFVMADYDDTNVVSNNLDRSIPSGVMNKSPLREFLYEGGGWSLQIDTSITGVPYYPWNGWGALATNTGGTDTVSYTFCGTGFDIVSFRNSSSGTEGWDLEIDGVAYTTATVDGGTNDGGGSYTFNSATNSDVFRLSVSGLSDTVHTLKFIRQSSSSMVTKIASLLVRTPTYFPKTSAPMTFGNTLRVGSNALGDSRGIGLSREQVYFNQDLVGNENFTSGSDALMGIANGLQNTIDLKEDSQVEVEVNLTAFPDGASREVIMSLWVNGSKYDGEARIEDDANGRKSVMFMSRTLILPKGQHHLCARLRISSGTTFGLDNQRSMIVRTRPVKASFSN